jgi:hypothetical protein
MSLARISGTVCSDPESPLEAKLQRLP